MVGQLKQKPLWIAGAAVVGTMVGIDALGHALDGLGSALPVGMAIAAGALWWRRRSGAIAPKGNTVPVPSSRDRVVAAIARTGVILERLQGEIPAPDLTKLPLDGWRDRLAQLTAAVDRPETTVAIVGGAGVGKTTLTKALAIAQPPSNFQWIDTPSLFVGADAITEAGSDTDPARSSLLAQTLGADVVLFVTAADLTATEFDAIAALTAADRFPLVVFNKQDRYLPADREAILTRLGHELHGQLTRDRIVAIAAAPAPIKVRRHQTDGTVQEFMEQPAPDLTPLVGPLQTLRTAQGDRLRWQTITRETAAVQTELLTILNSQRRSRAISLVEQSQWIAGAAAFANPMPGLDLVATAAVNGQLVLEVGQIYQQKFSLDRAQGVAATLAELLIKQGAVELASQAIGSALKASAVTYAVGGAVQGISAAYLTRIAGQSLIDLFEAKAIAELTGTATDDRWFAPERLTAAIAQALDRTRQGLNLQTFVQQALQRLPQRPASAPATAP
ncbi:MAG: DUF697 domain-containing protein [Cyanobacteria bacterium]|nr:DUF697 domain-containing protein [Cyanobacteriota bacterium]